MTTDDESKNDEPRPAPLIFPAGSGAPGVRESKSGESKYGETASTDAAPNTGELDPESGVERALDIALPTLEAKHTRGTICTYPLSPMCS